ncbi:hypothetical protein GQ53DRAFT_842910 [Thozetella sp. PMI_491]|nr:hypothetical protein GQ53DRAFT_842910 [Thozetella sp. PMI_491]
MSKSMHPIRACVDASEEGQRWFNDMNQDPSYVSLVWYIGKAYADVIKSPAFGRTSAMYMNKTIHFVQQRLADDSLATTDTTLFGVLALAMVTDGLGNIDGVKWHLNAISQLIKLRGGMAALSQKPSLQIKCCRFDLRFSLQNGTKPYFFDENTFSWSPYLADSQTPQPTTPLHDLSDNPDIRLVNTWLDLRRFTTALNLAYQTRRKVSSRLVQESVISVQYRLMYLAYDDLEKFETIRVAMLAFSMTLLTEMNGVLTVYWHLIGQLRQQLQSLKHNGDERWSRMILWFTFIGRLSVLGTSDDSTWLRTQLCSTKCALDLVNWAETRQVLKSILWVDAVHDEGGKNFFEEIETQSPKRVEKGKAQPS